MKVELVTITMERLRHAFETAAEQGYGSYPNSATVQSFLRMVEQAANVRARDIVGTERERLLRPER